MSDSDYPSHNEIDQIEERIKRCAYFAEQKARLAKAEQDLAEAELATARAKARAENLERSGIPPNQVYTQ